MSYVLFFKKITRSSNVSWARTSVKEWFRRLSWMIVELSCDMDISKHPFWRPLHRRFSRHVLDVVKNGRIPKVFLIWFGLVY